MGVFLSLSGKHDEYFPSFEEGVRGCAIRLSRTSIAGAIALIGSISIGLPNWLNLSLREISFSGRRRVALRAIADGFPHVVGRRAKATRGDYEVGFSATLARRKFQCLPVVPNDQIGGLLEPVMLVPRQWRWAFSRMPRRSSSPMVIVSTRMVELMVCRKSKDVVVFLPMIKILKILRIANAKSDR